MNIDDDNQKKPVYLDCQLETCVEDFEKNRDTFWKGRSDGGDWGQDEKLYGFAEKIAIILLNQSETLLGEFPNSEVFNDEYKEFFKTTTALTELVRSKLNISHVPAPLEDFIESANDKSRPPEYSLIELVWERLCIKLAGDFASENLVRGATRILRLVGLVKNIKPGAVTLRYLKRVSRCYILGLDVECAILCRGAIEAALKDALPEPFRDLHLARSIQQAAKLELLDEDRRKAAHRVNDTAVEGAHFDPNLVSGILTIIKDMLSVVSQLAKTETRA